MRNDWVNMMWIEKKKTKCSAKLRMLISWYPFIVWSIVMRCGCSYEFQSRSWLNKTHTHGRTPACTDHHGQSSLNNLCIEVKLKLQLQQYECKRTYRVISRFRANEWINECVGLCKPHYYMKILSCPLSAVANLCAISVPSTWWNIVASALYSCQLQRWLDSERGIYLNLSNANSISGCLSQFQSINACFVYLWKNSFG